MTRTKNVRNTTKFKRSIKAISPVIATLLMIAIAVVASLVVYAWVTGYIGGTTSTAGKAIQIQSFASQGGKLVVYVQNVGQGDVELNRDQSVYVNSNLVPLINNADAKNSNSSRSNSRITYYHSLHCRHQSQHQSNHNRRHIHDNNRHRHLNK